MKEKKVKLGESVTTPDSGLSRLFVIQSHLVDNLSIPTPLSRDNALTIKVKKAKSIAFLKEIYAVENRLSEYEVDDEDIFFLEKNEFRKKVATSLDHITMFKGDYLELVFLNSRNRKYKPSWILTAFWQPETL